MKGYSIDSSFKEKLLNEYNNEYGLNFQNPKFNVVDYYKPKNKKNNLFKR